MTTQQELARKRGHNTLVTGLSMLVFGIAIALATAGPYGNIGLQGWAILTALAGLITTLIGIGRRRETPPA